MLDKHKAIFRGKKLHDPTLFPAHLIASSLNLKIEAIFNAQKKRFEVFINGQSFYEF